MKQYLLLLTAVFLSISPLTVQARAMNGHSSDMLLDRHWYYPRPSVPSDTGHGQDMLPSFPHMMNENADMFGAFKPRSYATRTDMLPRRYIAQIPVSTLVIDR